MKMREARAFLFALMVFGSCGAHGQQTNDVINRSVDLLKKLGKSQEQQPSPGTPSGQPPASSSSVGGESERATAQAPQNADEQGSTSSGFDIAGIRLGMSMSEAIEAIKSAQPRAKIEVLDLELAQPVKLKFPAFILALQREGRGAGEAFVLTLASPPSKPAVVQVHRTVAYAKGSELALDQVQGAYVKKYGKPQRSTNGVTIWGGARNTQAMIQCETLGHQGRDVFPGDTAEMGGPYLLGATYPDQEAQMKKQLLGNYTQSLSASAGSWGSELVGCGRFVRAKTLPMNSRMVQSIITVVADGPAIKAMLDRTNAGLANAARSKQSQQINEAQKRGAPKL